MAILIILGLRAFVFIYFLCMSLGNPQIINASIATEPANVANVAHVVTAIDAKQTQYMGGLVLMVISPKN